MGGLDALITIAVILTFVFFVGSKVYSHEKKSIDPMIKKIKGWFIKEDDGDDYSGSDEDFELAFRGQIPNY